MSIILDRVRLTYPDGDSRLVALDDVSLEVNPGQLVAVTGPSGSGKSSLLAVAGLLLRPDTGRVLVGDVDATSLSSRERTALRRERIGFVFQQSNLLASLTAKDQLLVAAHLAGRGPREVAARADALLASLGLADASGRRPHQLSGGQRQRVGIARALVNEPTVLLVDEPTSALDRQRGEEVVNLLADLAKEQDVAVVMVTHDLSHLARVDQVFEMHDGVLAEAVPVS